MKFLYMPMSKTTLYLYFIGSFLLAFAWLDHYAELFLLTDVIRIKVFIVAIIVIAIAAIINLAIFIGSMYFNSDKDHNNDNSADDR